MAWNLLELALDILTMIPGIANVPKVAEEVVAAAMEKKEDGKEKVKGKVYTGAKKLKSNLSKLEAIKKFKDLQKDRLLIAYPGKDWINLYNSPSVLYIYEIDDLKGLSYDELYDLQNYVQNKIENEQNILSGDYGWWQKDSAKYNLKEYEEKSRIINELLIINGDYSQEEKDNANLTLENIVEEKRQADIDMALGVCGGGGPKIIKGAGKAGKFHRSMSERRKALLRDANDPNSELSQEARDYIKNTDGYNVPDGYEVSHEVPLYTEKTIEGKKKLDVADNMKTVEKPGYRDAHKNCGTTFHLHPPSDYK